MNKLVSPTKLPILLVTLILLTSSLAIGSSKPSDEPLPPRSNALIPIDNFSCPHPNATNVALKKKSLWEKFHDISKDPTDNTAQHDNTIGQTTISNLDSNLAIPTNDPFD